MYPDGTWDGYQRTSGSALAGKGSYVLVEKWTDSEGNIWYKMHVWYGPIFEGHPGSYELDKFSESGKVWESLSFKDAFPSEIDKSIYKYNILYRQE